MTSASPAWDLSLPRKYIRQSRRHYRVVSPFACSKSNDTSCSHSTLSLLRYCQTHDHFANLGVPCIPFLFPVERTDYLAVQQWFRRRPYVDKVAIEAQMYKSPRDLECLLQEMKNLEHAAKRCLHFVVVGPSTAKRIHAMVRRFSATIVTWKPFHEARTGSLCNTSLGYSKSFLTREELVDLNFQQYERFCNWAIRRLRSTA